MGCAVGLLLALGLYVFLGARAEAALVASSQQTAHSEGCQRHQKTRQDRASGMTYQRGVPVQAGLADAS